MQHTLTRFISNKAENIQQSITMAITAEANKLKQQGVKVCSFSAGEPDFDTPENVKEAGITAIKQGKTKYTPATGIIELKNSICNALKHDYGVSYTPSEIVVSCGAKHALYNTLLASVNPGEEVIIPTPYWVSYPHMVRLVGGTPIFLQTNEATDFKVTPQLLEKVTTQKTKAIFINSPSNPSGAVYEKEELEAIARFCLEHSILIISDEIYDKLVYGGAQHYCMSSLSNEIKQITVLINGVSKSYSMTGWRIGYSAAAPELTAAIGKIQSHCTSNPTTPSQWASVEAYEHCVDKIKEMRNEFDRRRRFMVEKLNQIPGFACLEPKGAFYAFPNISSLFGKSCKTGTISNSVEFCSFLLKECQVACVPGSAFGAEENIRLSYATSLEEIEEGLARLKDWVTGLT
ncbi:pyridoxal phosphate-dependent aminotransferase [Thermoproteota archaeon]